VQRKKQKKSRPSKDFAEQLREYGRAMGKLGGKKRSENLTPERRREIARKAAMARWTKAKKH
jgi:hypothetical protein